MENALDKALANASLNAKMNGDSLHTENLDSIADPSFDKLPDLPDMRSSGETHFAYNRDGIDYVVAPKPPEYNPSTVAFSFAYQQEMEEEYKSKVAASNTTTSSIHHLSVLTQVISDKTNWIQQQLTEVYAQLSRIETTITTAAQSMPQELSHKHRSLHEWDDQYLVNELVERENDLMPFYYELLKRIGSPELQSLVMSSMQGKNNSMVTLAQLCAALGSMSQPQPQYYTDTRTLTQEETASVIQKMSKHTRFQSQPQVQAQTIPEIEHQRLEQMSSLERQNFAQQMNTVIPKSPYFEAPPTYNPYFKER